MFRFAVEENPRYARDMSKREQELEEEVAALRAEVVSLNEHVVPFMAA
jgi:hypothetical protein